MGLFNSKVGKKSKKIVLTNAMLSRQISDQRSQSEDRSQQQIPSVSEQYSAQETSEGLFEKCPNCFTVLYADDLMENQHVCMNCGYHFRLTARQRIAFTVDDGSFCEMDRDLVGKNPLDFPGYEKKLGKIRTGTGEQEAIVTGTCTIGGERAVIAVMNGYFMMGSMGAAVGEKFTLAAEKALEERIPLIAFTVSGGARMQEGLVSLMQMAKTSAVLGKLDQEKIPYFVVLTDPTTGGVTASFAMLGDITLAEPDALVGFAGRRVIEQTVRQTLPDNFQRAEFLLEKGFIDKIVPRKELPGVLCQLIKLHKERWQNG